MKFAVFSALFLFATVVSAFHVVPPSSITTCAPLTVEYDTTTGIPPFSLSFHTDGADGTVVAAFTDISGDSFTWDMVTIPAGTNVVIVLADSSGLGSATPPITVTTGSSDVCLNNPTSIPTLPSITSTSPPTSTFNISSTSPPTSTFNISSIPSSSLVSNTTLPPSSTFNISSIPSSSLFPNTTSITTNTTTVSTPTPSPPQSPPTTPGAPSPTISPSSTLPLSPSTSPRPTPTGGLATSDGIAKNAGFFSIGAVAAIVGALLA